MPAPWQRRRTTDSPRPAGRRWAGRLRRSGSLARQMLRGGPRRGDAAASTDTVVLTPIEPDPRNPRLRRLPRLRMRRRDGGSVDVGTIAPVSPAPVAVGRSGVEVDDEPPPLSIPLLPGERTLARKLRFALVNACTITSLVLGLTAILLVVNGSDVRVAAALLIGCVVVDGLDGALARKLRVASPFGAQMDSLADMCSFGLAAPVVVYAWLSGSAPTMLIIPACALIAVCAAIRLARFNVSPKDGRYFCGVPTTMCAAVLALGALIGPEMPATMQVVGVGLLGLAMVSSFPYAKVARLLRLPAWLLLLPFVGLLVNYELTFVVLVMVYLVSGPALWVRNRRVAV